MDHLTSANWYTDYNGFGELVGEEQGLPQMQLGVDGGRQFPPHHHIQYPTPVTSVPGDGVQYAGEPGVFVQEDVQLGVQEAIPFQEPLGNHQRRPNKAQKVVYMQQNLEKTMPNPESHHKHQHHPAKTEKIMCLQCHATFACLANLRNHMRIHTGERPYVCEECGASFTQRSNLRSHKRVHTGERPYMCGICGQTFARSSHLPGHMRTHTGERPFKCTRCDRSFATNQIMKNHMRTHTGERPFVCEVCEATFAQSSCLATHKKIHTGERNFKCVRCGKAFISKSGLQTHERVHTGEKPYKCEKCSKSFKTSSYLSKHKQKYCGNSFTSKVRRPEVKKSVRKTNGTRKLTKPKKVVKMAGRPPKRNRSKRLKLTRCHQGNEFEVDNIASRFSSPENITEHHTTTIHSEVKFKQGNFSSVSSKSNISHTDLVGMLAPPQQQSKPEEKDIVEDFVKSEYYLGIERKGDPLEDTGSQESQYNVYPGRERNLMQDTGSLGDQYNVYPAREKTPSKDTLSLGCQYNLYSGREDPLKNTGSIEDQYDVTMHTQFQETPLQQQMNIVDPELKDVSHEFPEGTHDYPEVSLCPQGISEGTVGMHSQSEGVMGIHDQSEGMMAIHSQSERRLGMHSQPEGTSGIHSHSEETLGIHTQGIQVLPPVSSIAMVTEAQQPSFTSEINPGGWYSRNYM